MQSETWLRSSQLVWCQPCHWCGGIVGLQVLSIGCFLQEKVWDVLVHEPQKFNGIYQKRSCQKRTANDINVNELRNTAKKNMAVYSCCGSNIASLPPTHVPRLGTSDLDSAFHLFCAWGHSHMQSVKYCKETNKDLLEKKTHSLIWRFSEVTV